MGARRGARDDLPATGSTAPGPGSTRRSPRPTSGPKPSERASRRCARPRSSRQHVGAHGARRQGRDCPASAPEHARRRSPPRFSATRAPLDPHPRRGVARLRGPVSRVDNVLRVPSRPARARRSRPRRRRSRGARHTAVAVARVGRWWRASPRRHRPAPARRTAPVRARRAQRARVKSTAVPGSRLGLHVQRDHDATSTRTTSSDAPCRRRIRAAQRRRHCGQCRAARSPRSAAVGLCSAACWSLARPSSRPERGRRSGPRHYDRGRANRRGSSTDDAPSTSDIEHRPATGSTTPVEAPDRNLALELVRVTEAAAMAAGRWVGRGDKNGADGAAVNAMRQLIAHRRA